MDAQSPAFLSACKNHRVDPALASAMIMVESGWNSWRSRFEPPFKWLWQPDDYAARLGQSLVTEKNQQKTSWGLLQIMGGTARECGYGGLLTMLCLPEIGLDWGLRYLAKKAKLYPEMTDQIAAYNAGTPKRLADGRYKNQEHVDKVLKAMGAT